MTNRQSNAAIAILASLVMAACASAPYRHPDSDPELLASSGAAQAEGLVSVFLRPWGDAPNELNVWLAPQFIDGEPVWMGQTTQFLSQRTIIEQALYGYLFDPNMNDARNYLLQNVAHSQYLDAQAWVNMNQPVSPDSTAEDFLGASYFTDGFRLVMWVASEPNDIRGIKFFHWRDSLADRPP